jgi:hypothetical protein
MTSCNKPASSMPGAVLQLLTTPGSLPEKRQSVCQILAVSLGLQNWALRRPDGSMRTMARLLHDI